MSTKPRRVHFLGICGTAMGAVAVGMKEQGWMVSGSDNQAYPPMSDFLAARGIDIHKLPYVVNYDLPRSADDYIHRIGRTARAGKKGAAVSFIGHEDQAHFSLIEKKAHIRLPRERIEGFALTGDPLPRVKGKAPIKGHRMSKKDKARALALKEG